MGYRGKHRKPSAATKNIARVAVAGMAVGAPLAIAATPAQAESGTNWDAIAQCESGGKWSTSTGNGFSGGLQFTPSTWKAYGGKGSPQNASREEQIQVAEKVKDGQGMGAWPVCSKKAGASGGKTKSTAKKAPQKLTTKQAPKQESAPAGPKSNPNGDYTVAPGDTLSKIAQQTGAQGGYQKLKDLNKGFINDADVIVVGQKIATK